MRTFSTLVLTVFAISLLVPAVALAEQDRTLEYVKTVADHYEVSYEEVNNLITGGIDTDDLAVVYFIASQTSVSAKEVAKQRITGSSWSTISTDVGVSPAAYNLGTVDPQWATTSGPAYDKALDHFRGPEADWAKAKLSDNDIVNLVNLDLISNHHSFTPFHVMRMRENGAKFVSINSAVVATKQAELQDQLAIKNANK